MMSEFQANIAAAKDSGEEWVETDMDVINRIMSGRDLGPAGFFIYQGIKVCPFGKKDELELEMNTPIGDRLHGKAEGKLEGR